MLSAQVLGGEKCLANGFLLHLSANIKEDLYEKVWHSYNELLEHQKNILLSENYVSLHLFSILGSHLIQEKIQ